MCGESRTHGVEQGKIQEIISKNYLLLYDATRLLLSSLCFLLIETGTEEEQNFAGVLDLIHKAKVIEGKEEEKSELDLMFDKRKEAAPKALSVQYYEEFKQAAGKRCSLFSFPQQQSSSISSWKM